MKLKTIFMMYIDGFRNMGKLGKKLWAIIILKFIVLFVVIKMLFCPNILQERFHSDKERADFVLKNLTGGGK